MKVINNSFLFFCFVIIENIALSNFYLVSQNISDSVNHHYQSLREINDSEDVNKALIFFRKKSENVLNKGDTISAAYYLEILSYGQYKMGNLYDSESSTIESFRLLDNIHDSPDILNQKKRLLNQLGMLYRQREDYDNSITYYNHALDLNQDFKTKISIVNNISNIYADKNQFEEAVRNLREYYYDVLLLKDSGEKATYLNNLGYYQSKINDPMSFENMSLALEIRKKEGELTGLFSSYRYLFFYSFDKGKKNEALKYAKKAEEISDLLNSSTYKLEALELKLQLNKNLDFKEYLSLNKSIEKDKLFNENKYASIKYDVEKEKKIANEAELKLKDNELVLTKQRSKITISIAITGLITLLSLFTFFILKSKHKKEKLQQVHNTESRISKRIHDELANDVYSSMVQLENNTASVSEVVDNLEDIYHKARDLSQEKTTIRSNKEFIDDLKKSLASFNNDDTNVIVQGLIPDIWIDISDEKKLIAYRVLKELLVNMRKHSRANLVSVIFSRKNNTIKIGYTDNGVGSYKNETSKGVGLVNAENRIDAIGGAFIFDKSTKNGFKITIEIPV